MTATKKLSPAQRGRLGGLRAAERMSAAERSARSVAGQRGLRDSFATDAGYQEHMERMRLRRHGYDVAMPEKSR